MSQIRVMTYNIGHYNMGRSETGFPDGLYDEKLAGLKEMLMYAAPDLIGLQEDCKWLDKAHTVTTSAGVFDPVWRFRPEGNGCTVRSKLPLISGSNGKITFSTGRHFRKASFKVDGKRLLFLSCHPTAHVGNSADRKEEYWELFDYVCNREMWDWCVITGDFNTIEAVDKENLRRECDEHGFGMAIGSYMPWISTFPGKDGTSHGSYDNILVSSGVDIRAMRVMRDWYPLLYSDHVPLAAELILN